MKPVDWGDLVQEAQRIGYHRGYHDAAMVWCVIGAVGGIFSTVVLALLIG